MKRCRQNEKLLTLMIILVFPYLLFSFTFNSFARAVRIHYQLCLALVQMKPVYQIFIDIFFSPEHYLNLANSVRSIGILKSKVIKNLISLQWFSIYLVDYFMTHIRFRFSWTHTLVNLKSTSYIYAIKIPPKVFLVQKRKKKHSKSTHFIQITRNNIF